MHPMKPVVGMTGFYFNPECSLEIEVISYEELSDIERIGLKIIKNRNGNSDCVYKGCTEFVYSRKKGEEDSLEGLILE